MTTVAEQENATAMGGQKKGGGKKQQPKEESRTAAKKIKLTPGMWVAHDEKEELVAYGKTAELAFKKASAVKPKVDFYLSPYLGNEDEGDTVELGAGEIELE